MIVFRFFLENLGFGNLPSSVFALGMCFWGVVLGILHLRFRMTGLSHRDDSVE
jgi:hypothetical protein